MKTDRNGETSWTTKLFKIGLNRWLVGNADGSGYYGQIDKPTQTTFKNQVVYNADNNHPSAADTVEVNWGSADHYNNHPQNQTLGHWLVIRGYGDYGDRTYYHDPADDWWSELGVDPSFNRLNSNFVPTYLHDSESNGMLA